MKQKIERAFKNRQFDSVRHGSRKLPRGPAFATFGRGAGEIHSGFEAPRRATPGCAPDWERFIARRRLQKGAWRLTAQTEPSRSARFNANRRCPDRFGLVFRRRAAPNGRRLGRGLAAQPRKPFSMTDSPSAFQPDAKFYPGPVGGGPGPTMPAAGAGALKNLTIQQLMREAIDRGASDLHMTAGVPPIFRVDGSLRVLENCPAPHSRAVAEDRLFLPERRAARRIRAQSGTRLLAGGRVGGTLPRQRP
jgi:hypothetical protein